MALTPDEIRSEIATNREIVSELTAQIRVISRQLASYSINDGQVSQSVARQKLSDLRAARREFKDEIADLEVQLGGYGSICRGNS